MKKKFLKKKFFVKVNWKLIKHETIMKIYMFEENHYVTYKGVFSLDIDFLTIRNIFDVNMNVFI